MSLTLVAVFPRHDRRLRLLFSAALAAGAFTSTIYYAVASTDSAGANPSVSAAIAVPNEPNAAELALDPALVAGGSYTVTLTAVPALAGGTCSDSDAFVFGAAPTTTNVEPETDDTDELLYGVDLVWAQGADTGGDYVETADGDLATITGPQNAIGAVERRLRGEPLAWDPTYSARAYDFVDAPPGEAPTLRSSLVTQAREDNRVIDASCTVSLDDEGNAIFDTIVQLVGNAPPQTVSQTVNT
jgi:hypothetical protein